MGVSSPLSTAEDNPQLLSFEPRVLKSCEAQGKLCGPRKAVRPKESCVTQSPRPVPPRREKAFISYLLCAQAVKVPRAGQAPCGAEPLCLCHPDTEGAMAEGEGQQGWSPKDDDPAGPRLPSSRLGPCLLREAFPCLPLAPSPTPTCRFLPLSCLQREPGG